MTEKIFDKARYDLAQKVAYDLLHNLGINSLPIRIKSIIREIPNLYLKKYSTFAKEQNLTTNEVASLVGSEEGALWSRKKGDEYIYVILYNDQVANTERVRFTLAHELGHFMLKHAEQSDSTILNRYSLTHTEHDNLEKEANFFARNLLVPLPLTFQYLDRLTKIDAIMISETFQVSNSVAKYVVKNINSMRINNIFGLTHPLTTSFIPYIKEDVGYYYCENCYVLSSPFAKYCHLCRVKFKEIAEADRLQNYMICRAERSIQNLKYKEIELDNDSIAYQCPVCENEDLIEDAKVCQVCGTFVQNVCLGHNPLEVDEFLRPIHAIRHEGEGCSALLHGDARYCHECAGVSSFKYQGILTHWEHEHRNTKQINDFPFLT